MCYALVHVEVLDLDLDERDVDGAAMRPAGDEVGERLANSVLVVIATLDGHRAATVLTGTTPTNQSTGATDTLSYSTLPG